MANDGQRLDFGQVDAVERENREHLRERPLFVGQRKHEAGLVGLLQRAHEVGLVRVADHQKAREIVLVVFDFVLQHLQAVHLRCLGVADGRPALALVPPDVFRRACRVLGLHRLQRGVVREKRPALHQCHRMRVNLGERLPRVFGQTADAVLNVELVLTHDRRSRVAQQLIVVEQRASDGVFDGRQSDDRRVALDLLIHLLKRRAADELHLLAAEVLSGRNVVERPQFALYCNSFHLFYYSFYSRFPLPLEGVRGRLH